MKAIVEKLNRAEREMSEEKGAFVFFAFFLREDAPDVWDLIVSAPWISEDKSGSLKYIARKIQQALTAEELLKLSRIVIIEQGNLALDTMPRAVQIEHGALEILNSSFLGLQIKHGFIITSRNEGSPRSETRLDPGPQPPGANP